MAVCYGAARMGAWTAIGAYVALWIGMLLIGAPAQQKGIVAGLWITEALAIALPAVLVLLAAGVRLGPYLGFRKITWKQALIAVVVASANQPVVSFLTWIEHELLPASIVADFDAKQRMLDAVFRIHAVPMVLTVTLAAPLGEEIFFRGFAFPALQRSWGVVAALYASGIFFSLLHQDLVGFVALGAVLLFIGLVLLVRVVRRPSPAPAVEEPRQRNLPALGLLGAVWLAAVIWGALGLIAIRR